MRRALLLAILLLATLPACALVPRDLDRVRFDPVAGARLPLHARFTDETGHAVSLGRYFDAHPVIVVLGYYGCSNLCGLVLQGLLDSLGRAQLHAGRDAEIVVVSVAPDETPLLARAKKRSVLEPNHVGEAGAWHFLTGDATSIDALTHALGYSYAYDAPTRQYAHGAGITIAGRDGRVRSMLPGIVYSPVTLRAALDGASLPPSAAGDAATTWLLCLHYDPATGRYTFAAMTAVRLASLATLVALAGFALRARLRERHAGKVGGER